MIGELTPIERVALRAMQNPPDSLQQRVELMEDILAVITFDSEIRLAAKEILHHLLTASATLANLQSNLPLNNR